MSSLARAFVVYKHFVKTLRKLRAKNAHGRLKKHKQETFKVSVFVCQLIDCFYCVSSTKYSCAISSETSL